MTITISDNIKSSLEENDVFYLNGDIDAENTGEVVRFLMEKNFQVDRPDHVSLIFNTFGGEVNHGFSIIDVIDALPFPVWTYAIGQIYSCGVLLFCAGAKGHRYIFPHCSIMAHQWSVSSDGKKDELEAREKENRLTTQRMINHFMKCTGKTKAEVEDVFFPRVEHYFTPKEAIKAGMADAICTKL